MVVVSLEDFVETVRQSGLVPETQFQQILTKQEDSPADPSSLCEELISSGLITPWQRDKLVSGKYRGFFLGKYKLLAELGAGGMGTVFLAEHRIMRHRVAIKTMAQRTIGNEGYRKRFEQEARAAATVSHPRVVRAFDFDVDRDIYFLVMEYVEGEDLQKIVHRDGIMPIPVAAECIRQAAEGLEAIHQAGLIHRDIKPSNLLVDLQGNVRILDLGLARIESDESPSLTLMHEARIIGTADFVAPEQARNSHHIDHRADLYSLGGTFYFLLTGRPPFATGSSMERVIDHQIKLPTDVRKLRSEVPAEVAYLCHKLLAKKPEDRMQSAAEVVEAIGNWLQRYENVVREVKPISPKKALPAEVATGGSSTISLGDRSRVTEELMLAEDEEMQPAPATADKRGNVGGEPDAKPSVDSEPDQVDDEPSPVAESSLFDELPPLPSA